MDVVSVFAGASVALLFVYWISPAFRHDVNNKWEEIKSWSNKKSKPVPEPETPPTPEPDPEVAELIVEYTAAVTEGDEARVQVIRERNGDNDRFLKAAALVDRLKHKEP